jgi:hypothetical protein
MNEHPAPKHFGSGRKSQDHHSEGATGKVHERLYNLADEIEKKKKQKKDDQDK